MNTFLVRAVSAIVVAAIFIAAILYSRISYGIAMIVVVTGAVYEFQNISRPARRTDSHEQGTYIALVLTVLCVFLSWALNFKYKFADTAILLPAVLFFYFVRELFVKSETPFEEIAWNVLPFIYIVLPVMLLHYLYFAKGELFALSILVLIWVYDSFCYIWGSLIGRTKLFERISPKKTIEGLLGGLITTLTLAFFYDRIQAALSARYGFHTTAYTSTQWMLIGFVTLIFATFGDLVESQLKRSLHIKDSGSILPGHGGFLDRLDALFLAIPFATITIWCIDEIPALLG